MDNPNEYRARRAARKVMRLESRAPVLNSRDQFRKSFRKSFSIKSSDEALDKEALYSLRDHCDLLSLNLLTPAATAERLLTPALSSRRQ